MYNGFMESIDNKIIESIKSKYDLIDIELEQKLVLHKQPNGKILAGITFYNDLQDKCFYLFDIKDNGTSEEYEFIPVAQIKFLLYKNDTVFIRRLEFINQDYKGKGYASCLISFFEEYCYRHNYQLITGELIPLHNEPFENVKKFYTRNGYKISTINGQNMISKVVEQTEQNVF